MTLTLPTTRDEDWRYASAAELEALTPEVLDDWHEATLAPGETYTKTLIFNEKIPGLHRVRLNVGEGARAEIFAIVAAAPFARLEVDVTLAKGAHFEFGGVTLGGDGTQEIVTRVHHAPHATSNQTVRSVQWGQSVGNFLGRIEIPRDSQEVDAAQNFKAILLEAGATANAKPELEIFADDVKAAHGAAIGALDEQAGFYMASRGIPPHIARKLLVRAFIADAFAQMPDEDERDAMLEQALAVLGDDL
ncbi:MAG: SufD family Fe-S cluster assembly protein [Sphingomonadaceae bacterium]